MYLSAGFLEVGSITYNELQIKYLQYVPSNTLRKVQKIQLSENTFQSFNMEVYENIFL